MKGIRSGKYKTRLTDFFPPPFNNPEINVIVKSEGDRTIKNE